MLFEEVLQVSKESPGLFKEALQVSKELPDLLKEVLQVFKGDLGLFDEVLQVFKELLQISKELSAHGYGALWVSVMLARPTCSVMLDQLLTSTIEASTYMSFNTQQQANHRVVPDTTSVVSVLVSSF